MIRYPSWIAKPAFWFWIALVAAAGLKTWLVIGNWVPFNSDEAVVGLMARHILQGARPIFFYGQAYMGSLDAFLVAGGFAVFGEQVWVIRLVQSLLYLGFLGTTALLGKEAFADWKTGILAVFLLAIPPVNVTLYTTASLGGYGEALLTGNLILLCALQIRKAWLNGHIPGRLGWWAGFGFLSGLGLWAFGLSLVFSLAAGIYLLLLGASLAKKQPGVFRSGQIGGALGVMAIGGAAGSLPWWLFALRNGFQQLIIELSGGAIAGIEGGTWGMQILQHAASLFLFGGSAALGLRPPWDVFWLGLPLLPFVLLFWMGVLAHAGMRLGRDGWSGGPALLVWVFLTLGFVFILTPFGADPSGRYFLPWAAPLALFAADLILRLKDRYGRIALALAGLVLVYQFWGTLQAAFKYPPGITTQFYSPTQIDHRFDRELIAFLEQHGERRGYSNYWTTYPLAFLSNEDLIFVPRLPYHLDLRYTARDDRYPPYGQLVEQAERVAYITTRHPDLDRVLRDRFAGAGIVWKEAQIGDYRVFYALSRVVRPAEIGLGETTRP